MKILVVTHSKDVVAPTVTTALQERGVQVVRFDSDLYPSPISLTLDATSDRTRVVLGTPDGEHDLAALDSIWFRRLMLAEGLPRTMPAKLRVPAMREARRSYLATLAHLRAFTVDPYHCVRAAENKGLQLRYAREIGLDTPRTLVTSDPAEVRRFAATCSGGMITKMMSPIVIREEGKQNTVFTNEVREQDLQDLDGLRLCPMTFQEKLAKKIELRATVVGDRVFTAKVDSAAEDGAEVDWRRRASELMDRWRPYELPRTIEEKLLQLTARFHLHYSAADFVVTPDGRHVFLESNPSGEFHWLNSAGLPIVDALAELLIGTRGRRFDSQRAD